jgi:hypothetical protein
MTAFIRISAGLSEAVLEVWPEAWSEAGSLAIVIVQELCLGKPILAGSDGEVSDHQAGDL